MKYYVLPKFAVKLTTDRDLLSARPTRARHVERQLLLRQAGQSKAQVTLEGYTFDVERTVRVQPCTAQTDANGNFEFEFDLPAYLTGSDLENGLGRFYVQASVIDQAQHTEVTNLSLPVSANPIVIRAIPESGQFAIGRARTSSTC